MNSYLGKIWTAADSMVDAFLTRLPAFFVALLVFLLFYGVSRLVSRVIRRATTTRRHNVGIVFARLIGSGVVFLGFLVAVSIVAPSFQAGDLIKVLGIGSVAIGFAFQNIFQNFLAGLLLLWTEPFRVGDQIRLDNFEGTVEDIETRATTIRTYDGRRVIIPNADLFTHSVTINTAFDSRRWESDISIKGADKDLVELKSSIVQTIGMIDGVLPQPAPEVLIVDLGEPGTDVVKVRVTCWTRPSRHHQMIATHDRVLSAIRKALRELEVEQAFPAHPSEGQRRVA